MPGPGGVGCLLLGGVCSWGGLLLGGLLSGGGSARGGGMPGADPLGMATAAGGTHPTGMHSCCVIFSKRMVKQKLN